MISRREFARRTALGLTAAALPSFPTIAAPAIQKSGLKKGLIINMLPKDLSYVDRFKLAIDCGFEGVEANTVYDQKEAEAIKEASMKTGFRVHSVMNSDHWKFPLSDPDPAKIGRAHV